MRCQFCHLEFQTTGRYGRHLRSEHPESAIGPAADTRSWQKSPRWQKRALSLAFISENLCQQEAKHLRGTADGFLAAAAHKVFVPPALDISKHNVQVDDSQDPVGDTFGRVIGTAGL